MFLSLFISNLFIELGLFKKLEFIGRPLVRLANLPGESAITFVTSFGSVLAANTMLAQLYREKIIDRRQTFLSALLNGIPVYIKETFTYQIPIIIPILGLKIGGIYFLSFLLAGVSRLFFIIFLGRIKLEKPTASQDLFNTDPLNIAPATQRVDRILISAFRQLIKPFSKICAIFVSITFIVFLLMNSGATNGLKDIIQLLTDLFKLPASAAIGVCTYILNPLVGLTSIGTMARSGSLNNLQAITACMLGSLLALPLFAIRYSLPKYTAIFGFSLGSRILFVSTLLSMLVKGIILSAILFVI